MKKIHKSNVVQVSDVEYNELLHEVAVINGLQVPQTPEEVSAFEKQFEKEIARANRYRPSLKEIMNLAKEIKSSGTAIVKTNTQLVIDGCYKMAARNGNEITKETEELMDKAIQKVKEKRKND